MAEKKLEDAAELRRQGAAMVSHADALEREMTLLAAAGYYDTDGNPRTGEAGRKIWEDVQAQLHKVIPIKGTDAPAT
jgi:hypothetical protein